MSQPMVRRKPTRAAPMPLVSQRRADLAELERCMALSDCNEVTIDFRSGVGVYRPVMRAEKAAKPKPKPQPSAVVIAFRRRRVAAPARCARRTPRPRLVAAGRDGESACDDGGGGGDDGGSGSDGPPPPGRAHVDAGSRSVAIGA